MTLTDPTTPIEPRFQLTLGLTYACNLACPYCYVELGSGHDLSESDANLALDLALNALPDSGRLDLGFFGGEPMLRYEAMVRITEEADQRALPRNIAVHPLFTTNGTRFTESRVAWLAGRGVDVTVSLDGTREGHDRNRRTPSGEGSHRDVIEGIRMALEGGLALSVNMVVDPSNVSSLAKGVRDALDLGIRKIVISPNYAGDWEDESLDSMSRAYHQIGDTYVEEMQSSRGLAVSFVEEKILRTLSGGTRDVEKCAFGHGELAVDPRGRLFPCERLMRDRGGEEYVIGQLPDGIDPVRLEALTAPRKETPEDCQGCSLSNLCSHWCPCVNLCRTGKVQEPDGLVCFIEDLSIRVTEKVVGRLRPDLVESA